MSDLEAIVVKCRPTYIKELWKPCKNQFTKIPEEKNKQLCKVYKEAGRGYKNERKKYTLLNRCILNLVFCSFEFKFGCD